MTAVASLLVVAAIATVPIGAVAQEDVDNETTNATDAQLERDGDVIERDTHQVLSPTVRMTYWEYDSGTWTITIESDRSSSVTVSDSGALSADLSEGDGAGSGTITGGRQSYNVPAGETEIVFEARPTDDGVSAITLTARGGENIGWARTDAIETQRSPVAWQTVQILIGAAAIFAAGGTYRYVRKKFEEEKMEIERIL